MRRYPVVVLCLSIFLQSCLRGLAWSDPDPANETIQQTVSDLHTLLARSHEQGPYVLVGASLAGIFIQAYQRAYPASVAGLVFSTATRLADW